MLTEPGVLIVADVLDDGEEDSRSDFDPTPLHLRGRPKSRPSYRCGRCGQLKKGHKCPVPE